MKALQVQDRAGKPVKYLFIDQRTNKYYYIRFSKEQRKQKQFCLGHFDSYQKALRVGEKKYWEWIGRPIQEGKKILVKYLANIIIHEKKALLEAGKIALNTFQSTNGQLKRHVVPSFGHLRVDQITSARWTEYASTQGDRKLFNTRKALTEVLNRAYDDGFIRKPPKLENFDEYEEVGQYISRNQVLRILRCASRRSIRLLGLFVYKGGLRPTEALRLKWEYFDLKDGVAHYPARILKNRKQRSVPIHPMLLRILRARKKNSDSPYIFPMRGNSKRHMVEYQKGWYGAIARAEVEAGLYDLRRSAITDACKQAKSLSLVAYYFGNSIKVIEEHYFKPKPEDMNFIGEVL